MGTVYTHPTFFFFNVGFHNSCFIFLHFERTSNDYLVLYFALRSLSQIKPLHFLSFITKAKLCLFLPFPVKQSGKHFPKICTFIMHYFIYKNADLRFLGSGLFFFACTYRRHQKREKKKIPTTKKPFLGIFCNIPFLLL